MTRFATKIIPQKTILRELYSGKTIKEIKSTTRSTSVKRKQGQSTHPLGHSIDALNRLKLESEKTDKYYIFDIHDATLSGSAQRKTRF